ncbi:MAG: ribulose-phosphate 3-epimerase [Thermoleophilaceae bacterium]|nr:ribulose-phosphate 3-epimerase [Thermoleophilaceae bacterium]
MDDTPRIAPSILSADFARLGGQVAEVLEAGARVIHVDVMDGHFVPPITMGPIVVEALKSQVADAGGHLDVHLMVEDPERHVDAFAQAGADSITCHVEATPHLDYALNAIREHGVQAGLAVNPGTPPEAATQAEPDYLLCMTVNPGWGGQSFIPYSLAKIERLRELLPQVPIEVDGGIDEQAAPDCARAGAGVFVAGSAIFGSDDPAAAYTRIAASVLG